MKSAARTYVRARLTTSRLKRASSPRASGPSSLSRNNAHNYHTTHFRYSPPPPPPNIQDLALALEMPDFNLWVNELWQDFLIEPTPYLVASAICYVGGVLILVQYHWAVWWLACFVFRLLPWDDDLGFA
jgi:hypothetical protein